MKTRPYRYRIRISTDSETALKGFVESGAVRALSTALDAGTKGD